MDIEETINDASVQETLFKQIQELCLSFPGTSERISHGAPTFFINNKLSFVQYHVNHHRDGRIALWCSALSEVQAMLVESSPEIYFKPPYVGHRGWVGMRLDLNADWEEILGVIREAYFNRAPLKYRDQFKHNLI